jgi:Phage integrase, N-terminal SAM-like domain/Arm DNA-binding domain
LANFGLCVSNRGAGPAALTYFYYYRDALGRGHRPTIGKHGRLTPEEARQIARKNLLAVSQGADPVAEKKAGRQEIAFEDFSKRYMDEWARVKKKPSTIRNDESLLRNHINPAFRGQKLSDVSQEDVRKLRHKLYKTPSQANRVVALVSHMFTWAEETGLRPSYSNPAAGSRTSPRPSVIATCGRPRCGRSGRS